MVYHEKLLSALQGQKLKVKANMRSFRLSALALWSWPNLFIAEVGERRGRAARQSYLSTLTCSLTGTTSFLTTGIGERLFDLSLKSSSDEAAHEKRNQALAVPSCRTV